MSFRKLVDPQQVWDERYARWSGGASRINYEPWLERWSSVLSTSADLPILDAGCGCGFDACYLMDAGFRVVGLDFSRQALCTFRRIAQHATVVQVDLRDGLPFLEGAFRVMVASLSLHYFPWRETEEIVNGIGQKLKQGGHLLARFNSTKDQHHGAVGYEAVEHHYYSVEGLLKRFFDEDDLLRLFGRGWAILGLEEQTIHSHRKPKVIWEVVAKRR